MKIEIFVENAIHTNTYVVIDEETKDAIIIDLGGGYNKILDYIKTQGADLKFILCTHGHFDHVMGISEMQAEGKDYPVYINKKDYSLMLKINDMLKMFSGLDYNYQPPKISDFIDENSKLKLGNKDIKIIETPGHTQGGVCFLIENYLFSGDSLFYREIGRCDLEGGDYQSLISSLKEKILTLPDDIKVLPGHGYSSTIGNEKLYNHYLQ